MRAIWPIMSCLFLLACGQREPADAKYAQPEKQVGQSAGAAAGQTAAAEHAMLPGVSGTGGKVTARQEKLDIQIDESWLAKNAELLLQQRQSVIEAGKGGHPERLSPMAKGKPFDRGAWKQSPLETSLAYAAVAEPARAHAAGAVGDPALELITPSAVAVDPQEGARVIVRVPPYAPVSVMSHDRATFGNGLVYATVVADSQGLAIIDVSIPQGTVNTADVIIACPVASEPAEILLDIH